MLFKQIQYFGLLDTISYGFKSYLFDRTQYVQYDGVVLANKLTEKGVPQG